MKYKINISEGCTAGGHLEVNGVAYSCEDPRYELTKEQREKFHEDLFTEIRRMFDNGEIGVNDLVQLLHVEDTHYSETCDQCFDRMVTTYYEFETPKIPEQQKDTSRFNTCDGCGKLVNIDNETGHVAGCDYVWGRRGWRQLGVYDG